MQRRHFIAANAGLALAGCMEIGRGSIAQAQS